MNHSIASQENPQSFHVELGLDGPDEGLRLKTNRPGGQNTTGPIFLATAENVVNYTRAATTIRRFNDHFSIMLLGENGQVVDMPKITEEQVRLKPLSGESNGPWTAMSATVLADMLDEVKRTRGTPNPLVVEHSLQLSIAGVEHDVKYVDSSSRRVHDAPDRGGHLLSKLSAPVSPQAHRNANRLSPG